MSSEITNFSLKLRTGDVVGIFCMRQLNLIVQTANNWGSTLMTEPLSTSVKNKKDNKMTKSQFHPRIEGCESSEKPPVSDTFMLNK